MSDWAVSQPQSQRQHQVALESVCCGCAGAFSVSPADERAARSRSLAERSRATSAHSVSERMRMNVDVMLRIGLSSISRISSNVLHAKGQVLPLPGKVNSIARSVA